MPPELILPDGWIVTSKSDVKVFMFNHAKSETEQIGPYTDSLGNHFQPVKILPLDTYKQIVEVLKAVQYAHFPASMYTAQQRLEGCVMVDKIPELLSSLTKDSRGERE